MQSDDIDHLEWGTFKDFKLEEDLYPYHYYHAIFDVYVLPLSVKSSTQPVSKADKAPTSSQGAA